MARDRRKTLKNEKEKRKMRKRQKITINIFIPLFFISKKLYFVTKHIWKNLVYIVTFV